MTNPLTDERRYAFERFWIGRYVTPWSGCVVGDALNFRDGRYVNGPIHEQWETWQAALSHQGEVVKDAERYRKVRNAPIGVAGVPCIALQNGEPCGEYVNGKHADAVVDGLHLSTVVEVAVSVDAIRNVIDNMRIAMVVNIGLSGHTNDKFKSPLDDLAAVITRQEKEA